MKQINEVNKSIKKDIIVENLMISNGVYLLVSHPKVGKSMFAQQLAFSLTTGEDFLGFKVNPSHVLYITIEGDINQLQDRFKLMNLNPNVDKLHIIDIDDIPDFYIRDIERDIHELTFDKEPLFVIIDMFKDIKLKDMDGNLYHKFQQDLWNKPIKCSTRNDVQKFLKIILNWGMKMYDINLMRFYKKIEFFKDTNEMKVEKDVYTFEEFQKYITGTTSLNDKTMFEMFYYCGLRRGECRVLQWSDIDWNNKLVSITKQANSVKDSQKYYELTPPKTSKSIRTLPLTEVLYNDLVNLYNEKKSTMVLMTNGLFSVNMNH